MTPCTSALYKYHSLVDEYISIVSGIPSVQEHSSYGSVGGWFTIIAYSCTGRGVQWGLLRHYANNKSGKGALEEERGQKISTLCLLHLSFKPAELSPTRSTLVFRLDWIADFVRGRIQPMATTPGTLTPWCMILMMDMPHWCNYVY